MLGLAVVGGLGAGTAEAGQGGTTNPVDGDRFTLRTAPLEPGQIELLTLSTLPDAVTGGDVLVEVRGLKRSDRVKLLRNGRPVRGELRPSDGRTRRARVGGLRLGRNTLTAIAVGPSFGRRVARLVVRNHPKKGPVVSGPHQAPFYCETEEAGLGRPRNEDCSAPTRYQWFYRSQLDQGFHELEDPRSYPVDVMQTTTSEGEHVPFVVRVESGTINRGIYRIAVLDDPASRRARARFKPKAWNRQLTYAFGESCGVGYHQGVNTPQQVLGGPVGDEIDADNVFSTIYGVADRLGAGDVVGHSTMTTFGVYCNPIVSAETLAMVKEHINETYGLIDRTVGVGGSGGALQQYNAVNNAPGLLDGAIPIASFNDILSTAMTVVDCGLLERYFERSELDWSDSERAAVAGHRTARICADWVDLFLGNLDPHEGCSGAVPEEVRYDAKENPDGVRCTLQDATKNIWGVNPRTGFAPRPYDNRGVQYGLRALNAGSISFSQFLDLNRRAGGYDLDANWRPKRNRMSPEVARKSYRLGGVIGRGALTRTPVIDLATYLDLLPLLDIHDVVRPFQVRARLREHAGTDATQTIWRGVSLPPDAAGAMHGWLDRLDADFRGDHRPRKVVAARPGSADDRCIVSGLGARADLFDEVVGPLGVEVGLPGGEVASIPIGASIPEQQEARGVSACQAAFPAASGTRIVAGGPFTNDVLKCRRKPVDRDDYEMRLSRAQLRQLRRTFPDGVCDWSRPGVGEVRRSMLWVSIGGKRRVPAHTLRWTVARSGS